jgi:chaperonin GroES
MAATMSSAAQLLSGSAVSSHFKFASFEGLTRGRSTRNNNGCCVQQFSSMQHHQAAFIPSLSSYSSSSRRSSCLTIRAATAVAPTFTTLKPLGDRILLKIQAVEEKSAGGILLPTTAQTRPQGGVVVAIGEGKTVGDKKLDISVNTGAQVVYSKYAGTEVEFNGESHLLLKEEDVVGLLSGDDVMELQPLNDRVLVQVSETESQTAGGVLLTESAKEKPVIGTVIATGPGTYGEDGERKPVEVSSGDHVLYSKYAGNEFKNKDGVQFVVLRVSDILAILA